MTPERWQQVKEVLHGALELAPERRSEFLDKACAADPLLRQDVESLLASSDEARCSFLQTSPVRVTLTKGTRLGDYEVRSLLGSGGMGEVYRARDRRLDRDVAIKVLPAFLSSDPDRLWRFEQEARAAAALNHPNILAVFQMGTYEGTPYLVSELLEGSTLREHVRRGPLPIRKAVDYAIQITRALAAAHDKGIVHRDLKPENLFVTKDGRVKILDFGLAKLTQPKPETTSTTSALQEQTESGMVMGTVGYMAPEQVRGESADHRADIFAFGAVLYEIVSGKRAFERPTAVETMQAILRADPPGFTGIVPEPPPGLQRIVYRCLEKDAAQRFQSAKDLSFALSMPSESEVDSAARLAALPRKIPLPLWLGFPAALIAIVTLVIWLLFLHKTHSLTDKDIIVLADFVNRTGDSAFDDTLKQALGVALRQSPFLNVLSDEKVTSTLKLMTRPPSTALTRDIVREVCQRAESKAYISGSITNLGSQYFMELQAVNCQNGDVLAQEQVTAPAKEKVLDALGTVASKLRRELGESLVSVQKFDVPLEQATTSSLEALKNFSIGSNLYFETGKGERPYYLRAVELDPNFARAHAALALGYFNSLETDLARQSAQRAYYLRGRCTEPERLRIEGIYYDLVTGELEKAISAYEMFARLYPRESPANSNTLTYDYWALGQYDKCLSTSLVTNRLAPEAAVSYVDAMTCYVALNRLQEAKDVYEQSLRKKANSLTHGVRYRIAVLENDKGEMERQASWFAHSDSPDDFLSPQAKTEAFFGRMGKARELNRRFTDAAQRKNKSSMAASSQAEMAVREAEIGNARRARQLVATAMKLGLPPENLALAAIVAARTGDSAGAQKIVDKLEKEHPLDTIIGYGLNTSKAGIEMDRHSGEKALLSLERTSRYEYNPIWNLYAVYLRGLANLQLHRGREAAADFQEILDHCGIVLNEVIGALAYLQLGRAYVLQGDGDTTKARAAYQDFLTLWKDADPDIPIFQQAKAEYAKLN